MKVSALIPCAIIMVAAVTLTAQQKPKGKPAPPTLKFEVKQLHKDNSEGVAVGDIDGDGKLDVVAGEFWYQAPEFRQLPVRKLMPFGADYLQNNSDHLLDMDGDGDLDVVAGAFTLSILNWYENPGAGNYEKGIWTAHELVDTGHTHNEATFLHDFDGDGQPEYIANSWRPENPMLIWRIVKGENGKATAEKHVVSESGNGHGLGFGDINGDGLEDIIFRDGWYERPADGPYSGPWEYHADFVLPHASCPILVVDLNEDGRNDVIWADGHSYGLYWEEQMEPQSDGTIVWRQHMIDKKFSQAHTMMMGDIDNDGADELITGKRYFAHSGKDPGAHDEITVHYYDWNPEDQTWKKNWISKAPAGEGPGIGLQIRLEDIDENGWKDVVVPGKSGTHILWNQGWTKPS